MQYVDERQFPGMFNFASANGAAYEREASVSQAPAQLDNKADAEDPSGGDYVTGSYPIHMSDFGGFYS